MSTQPAWFIFQLRRNITVEGDLALAAMELRALLGADVEPLPVLADACARWPCLRAVTGFGALTQHSRPEGCQAYVGRGPLAVLPALLRRIAFVQRLYCLTAPTEAAVRFCAELPPLIGPVLYSRVVAYELVVEAVPHYALIELSEPACRGAGGVEHTKRTLDVMLRGLLDHTAERPAQQLAERALASRTTTAHLSHGVHYYKAKFFPRMARALLNVGAARLGPGPLRVIDTFAGSGTTLLEASLLGMPSLGLDIDPLSVMIASAKIQALRLDADRFADEAACLLTRLEAPAGARLAGVPASTSGHDAPITFPAWFLKNRRMNQALAEELSAQIGAVGRAIDGADADLQPLLRVLMSDAITRKLRLRFLGTGVGRFALTVAATPIPQLFAASLARYVRVAATGAWLRERLRIAPAEAQVRRADARHPPADSGRFDLLLTSPPYLPASSGRESYTKARAPSLIALGLRDLDDIDCLVDEAIGSMGDGELDLDLLSPEERRTVDWLAADELRAIKAAPTARYFLEMRQAFVAMRRLLQPGAPAVVVSGKQSTFYQFSTRAVLHVVPVAELLAAEAAAAGFELEALHDVELQKSNRNARPRSLDEYYETLIMLRQPEVDESASTTAD